MSSFDPQKIPQSFASASAWFALAVIAGIAESIIAVVDGLFIDTDAYSGTEIVINLAFRAIVYGTMLVVIRFLRQGARWPAIVLTVVLGVIGMGTLVVPYFMWLADGNDIMQGIRDLDALGGVFAIVRVLHVVFVVLGVIYLYIPQSLRYYRGAV